MVNIRPLITTGLGLCVLVLGGWVWRQQQELTAMRWRFDERLDRTGAVIDEPTGAWKETRLTKRPREGREWATDRLVTGAVSPAQARRESEQLRGIAELMDDPRFIRALVSHQRTMLDSRFGELFRRLNLTDDELDIIKALLIEKQNSALDVLMVSRREGAESADGREFGAAAAMARSEIDGLIRQTLGEARYAVFKDFETSLPQRATVLQLAQRLSYSDQPLEPEQSEQLVALMVASGGVQKSLPGVSVVVDPEDRQAVPIVHETAETVTVSDEILALAGKILQPKQLAALHQIQQEQVATETLVALARESIPASEQGRESRLEGLGIQLLLQ